MFKKIKALFLITSILGIQTTFFSCENEEEVTPSDRVCNLSKVITDYDNTTIIYNDNGSLQKQIITENGGNTINIEFEYNQKGQLISRTSDSDGMSDDTFEYNAEGLLIGYESIQNTHTRSFTLQYNSDNKVIFKTEVYSSSPNDMPLISNYSYEWDVNGNMIKEEVHRSNDQGVTFDLHRSCEYEYDDKTNIFNATNSFLKTFDFDILTQNNVIKYTCKDALGAITSESETAYEYNTEGYPITLIETEIGSSDLFSVDLEYSCQ